MDEPLDLVIGGDDDGLWVLCLACEGELTAEGPFISQKNLSAVNKAWAVHLKEEHNGESG